MTPKYCIECEKRIPNFRSKRAKTCSVQCSNKRACTPGNVVKKRDQERRSVYG